MPPDPDFVNCYYGVLVMSPMGLSPTSAETQETASSPGATPTWMDASGTIVMFASMVGLFILLCLL